MNYVIQAALSNTQHPECGQVTISFPIPIGQYNKTIAMLQAIDLDFSVNRDCKVDEINSRYRVLNSIERLQCPADGGGDGAAHPAHDVTWIFCVFVNLTARFFVGFDE